VVVTGVITITIITMIIVVAIIAMIITRTCAALVATAVVATQLVTQAHEQPTQAVVIAAVNQLGVTGTQ